MIKIVFPDSISTEEFVERLATIATAAWTGYNSKSYKWRLAYYARLFQNPMAESSFAILEHYDEKANTLLDFGFVGILPLKEHTVRLHRQGTLSQYDFDASSLIDGISLRDHEVRYYYVQSLFLLEQFRKSPAAHTSICSAIALTLKRQGLDLMSGAYELYAETSEGAGVHFLNRVGFSKIDRTSHEGKPFYIFDSTFEGQTVKRNNDLYRWLCARVFGVEG